MSEDTIREVIKQHPVKCCSLDPLPADLFKLCLSDLIPIITKIINFSLCSGNFPDDFKRAIVIPLLKKPGLDKEVLKNYRPISNLPFLSKVLERVVLRQLLNHLASNGLLEIFQSAYRQNHSTETALLHVSDTLLSAADNNDVSILCLLDLSAAFDTIDHTILLDCLQHTFGISGSALNWFCTYLTDRSQSVMIRSMQSAIKVVSSADKLLNILN